jgi:hypothetical protein
VFAYSLDNPDYRSKGTYNKNHIRGYGLRGLRVFDFGWQFAQRGWGVGGLNSLPTHVSKNVHCIRVFFRAATNRLRPSR